MFLVLGLNVCGVLVVLLLCQLHLLQHPVLDLVGVAGELLQRLALAQLGTLLDQGLLQLLPAGQNLVLLACGVKGQRSTRVKSHQLHCFEGQVF